MANIKGIGGPKPGEARNPGGKNGRGTGYQTFQERAERWLTSSTADEIKRIHNDPKELNKRNPLDVAVLKFIYNGITARAGENENLRDLFEWLFSKPKQQIETKTDVHITDATKPVSDVDDWLAGAVGQSVPKPSAEKVVLN